MDGRGEEISIVELLGWSEGGKCGYCKDSKGEEKKKRNLGEEEGEDKGNSVCLGAWAHKLNVNDYQRLLNAGWRRSGAYMYKPDMKRTCCPQYTIRLDVDKFRLSRTQKRVLRNMRLYLEKGVRVKGEKEERGKEREKKGGGEVEMGSPPSKMEGGGGDREGRGEKKKVMRRRRAEEKWKRKGLDVEAERAARREKERKREKTLEERIGMTEDEGGRVNHLEVDLVRVGSDEYRARSDEEYLVFQKYQEEVHKDDDVSPRGFERFLGKSPLSSADPDLGSFHMRYILNGKLIAVGVLDILPQSVSAKYLFYDPYYSFLSLGTYTALTEIQLVKKLHRTRPNLKYYYMGYYISDCPKMRYKGTFRPSDLLCDETHQWMPLSSCSPLLSSNGDSFTVFSPSSPPHPFLDPMRAKLYQGGRIATVHSLSPRQINAIMQKLSDFCSYTAPNASKLVLVMKELQIENDVELESEDETAS